MFFCIGLSIKPLIADKVYWAGRYCVICHPVVI
jgi:hypothetical protein